MASTSLLALTGATIYPSPTETPIRDGIVLIKDNSIAAVVRESAMRVSENTERVDCAGLTITAGFWNSHIHLVERKWANAAELSATEITHQFQDMLSRFGFTSVFDLSSMWDNTRRLRDRVESGETSGPRIRTTGEGMIPPGALPPEYVVNFMGWMNVPVPEIADAGQAAATARRLLDQGVDGIKLFASSPRSGPIAGGAIEAAVREAHARGKPVFVHPNNGDDVLLALRSGVDVIAHTTPQSGPWDETILTEVKERRVALTPTLTIWKHYARHDRISAQDQIVAVEVGQLRAWISAGGRVLFGNDLGAVDYDPTEEYLLMAQAGMSFTDILESLTTAPAEQFGVANHVGRIAPGLQADLAVLNADPAKNIRAFADVRYTLRDGKIIHGTV